MHRGIGLRTGPIAVKAAGAMALALGLAVAAGAVEVVGTTEAMLRWDPASGPVAGYYVVVSKDGGSPQVDGVSSDPEHIVTGAYGETLVVQVAAFDAEGTAGQLSEPSDPITFVASSSDGGTSDGSGGGGGGGEEPLPDDGSGSGAGEPVPGTPLDFTGDGLADLVTAGGGSAALWEMNGAGVTAVTELPVLPAGADAVASGDFDGDGVSDLLWEEADTGRRWVWLFGDGGVVETGELGVSHLEPEGDWRVAGAADLDADGRDDVVLTSRVLGEVEIWWMAGASAASRSRVPGRVGAWSVAAVLGIGRDGVAGILWRDEVDHRLELDAPDGSATVPVADGMQGWRVVGTGDTDADGLREVLLRAAATGALEAWSIDAAGAASVRPLGDGPASPWSATPSGDHDGDGSDDWIWSDPASGAVVVGYSTLQGPVDTPVDRSLAEGEELASGAAGSDDSAFRIRFCHGADTNGDGVVGASDLEPLRTCYDDPAAAGCGALDLDGSGTFTLRDVEIFSLRYRGIACE